jgi:hypothetical protein
MSASISHAQVNGMRTAMSLISSSAWRSLASASATSPLTNATRPRISVAPAISNNEPSRRANSIQCSLARSAPSTSSARSMATGACVGAAECGFSSNTRPSATARRAKSAVWAAESPIRLDQCERSASISRSSGDPGTMRST